MYSALAATNGAYAQNSGSLAALDLPKHVFKIDGALITENANTVDLDAVNSKALKNFKKSYKTASGEKWSKISDGFLAEFTSNGISNKVYYNKKGQWSASLKGYGEDKFSRDIRSIVKHEYSDYKITYVEEIETLDTHGKPTYIVHVEDEDNIKLIRVSDGEMNVYKEYKKQK